MIHKEDKEKVKAKGTISLEAVLSFPLILMVIFIFISAIHMEQDAIILSRPGPDGARVALLMPLTDLAEQYIDPKEWIEKVIPDKALADIACEGLSDVAATVLGSPYNPARLDTWARATALSQQRMPPQGKENGR